mmetsp:Transcript_26497/g.99679  ORF Transcript_26497/g.99679 Transcript_26497/m.99679 type:complete len:242 (-) Transcript_26497:968-1693(-)
MAASPGGRGCGRATGSPLCFVGRLASCQAGPAPKGALGAAHHVSALPGEVGVDEALGDLLQHRGAQHAQQRPRAVEGVEDGPGLVVALGEEVLFKELHELEVRALLLGERLHAHNCAHGVCVLACRIRGVELVGHARVVLAGEALADGGLHQPREGRHHVDGRVHLGVVKLPVDVDLPLRDVAGEVGDGVGDVVVGHGQNGQLGDGAVAAADAASSLVDGGEVGVHVAGVGATAGHLLARR